MKHRFLLLALFILLWLSVKGIVFVLTAFLFPVFWYLHYRDHSFIYVALILAVFVLSAYIPQAEAKDDLYRVEVIRPYYVLLKNGTSLYYCDSLDMVGYDDILRIDGEISDIKDEYFLYSYSKAQYQRANGVYKQLVIESCETVKKGSSLRAKLYALLKQNENEEVRSFLMQVLFQISEEGEYQHLNSFMNSSGLAFSALFRFFKNLAGYLFFPEVTNILAIISLFLYGSMTHFSCTLHRLLLEEVFFFVKERDDRLGLVMIGMLLLCPDYRYSLAFQLPLFYRFFLLYAKERKKGDALWILIPLQLFNSGYYSLINALYYRLYRFLEPLLFFLSLLSALTGYSFVLPAMKLLQLCDGLFCDFYISGKLPLFLLVPYALILSEYLRSRQKKHAVCLAVILLISQKQSLLDPMEYGVFLNVHHGDCFIYHPAHADGVLMIDTGSHYNYRYVSTFLHAKGIHTIDYLIISHPDEDHNGNLNSLKEDFHIKHIIDEKSEGFVYKKHAFKGLLSDRVYDNTNDNSQIYLANICSCYVFFGGDISSAVERDLLDAYPGMQIDILKCSHHGSKTSSSFAFLSTYYPALAVISAAENSYHFPNEEVLDSLTSLKIPTLITKNDGDVLLVQLFGKTFVITAKDIRSR